MFEKLKMGSASSKTPKKPNNSAFSPSNKRASKRILKRSSAIYPSNVPRNEDVENIETNNNLCEDENGDSTVVIRNKGNDDEASNDESIIASTPKSAKKEKKKKRSEVEADAASIYHQTDVCYYKVENGKYLKLPNDTKHANHDCYVKMSNGSFRHLANPDGSRSEADHNKSHTRQSMPVQKTSDREKEKTEERQPQNRKVMVTMIDGGTIVASVRDRTSNLVKKEKEKAKVK